MRSILRADSGVTRGRTSAPRLRLICEKVGFCKAELSAPRSGSTFSLVLALMIVKLKNRKPRSGDSPDVDRHTDVENDGPSNEQ
jgi:hypothetical protein